MSQSRKVMARYLLAWFGMMVLAMLNGALRDALYRPRVGELAAHQISTVLLLVLFAAYFRWLTSRWPLVAAGQAWMIGLIWLVMTVAFEVILGRFILGNPWGMILRDYDIHRGRVWVLIPLWTLIGPYVFHRFGRRRRGKE